MQNVFLVAPSGRVVGESHSWQKTGTAVTTLVRQGLSTRRVIVRNRHSVCAGGLRHPCILRLPRAALSRWGEERLQQVYHPGGSNIQQVYDRGASTAGLSSLPSSAAGPGAVPNCVSAADLMLGISCLVSHAWYASTGLSLRDL